MIMSGRAERSAETMQHRREDRDGWLFAMLTVGVSCMVIIFGFASHHHPWH